MKHRCRKCGNVFVVPVDVECPFCGKSNRLQSLTRDLKYTCSSCKEVFEIELDEAERRAVESSRALKSGRTWNAGHAFESRRGFEYEKKEQPKTISFDAQEVADVCLWPFRFFLPLFLPFSYHSPAPRIEMWGILTALVLVMTAGRDGLNVDATGEEVRYVGTWVLLMIYIMACFCSCGRRRAIDAGLEDDIAKVIAFGILTIVSVILWIPGILYMFWVILKLLVCPSKESQN